MKTAVLILSVLFVESVTTTSARLLRSLAPADAKTGPTYTRPSDRPLSLCNWWCPSGYKRNFGDNKAATETCSVWKHGPGKCVDTGRGYVGETCEADTGCRGAMTCQEGQCRLLPARPQACTNDLGTCKWYKSCLAPAHLCDKASDEYAVSYGHRFCSGFFESLEDFTDTGKEWVRSVCHCLTSALVPTLDNIASSESQCTALRKYAFDSHPACYTGQSQFSNNPNLSICKMLHTKDLPTILRIVAAGVLNIEGVRQMIETAKTCTSQITGYAIDHFATIKVRVQQDRPHALGMEKTKALVAKAALVLDVDKSRIHLAASEDKHDTDTVDVDIVITAPVKSKEVDETLKRVRSSVELKEELSQLVSNGALDDESVGGKVRIANDISGQAKPIGATTAPASAADKAIPFALGVLPLLVAAAAV